MVPAQYVQVEEIPLTTNGKVNKKLLLEISPTTLAASDNYLGAQNNIQSKLIEIISDKLNRKIEQIGIHDNFFDLGATSLKMIQILNEINKAFNLDLKVVALFEHSSVFKLSKYMDNYSGFRSNDQEEVEDMSSALDDIIDFI
jgi:acyl carrier protein